MARNTTEAEIMAHAAHDFSEQATSSPREVPQKVKLLGIALVIVGVIATGIGLGTATDRTLATFVINFCYWAGIAQGGFMLAAILVITTGRWGRPLKRLSEAFVSYMPWLCVLLFVFMIGGGLEIYPWMHEEMPAHKAQYLKPGFFVARLTVGLGLLIVLSRKFVRTSLRADVGLAVHKYGVEKTPAHWAKHWVAPAAATRVVVRRSSNCCDRSRAPTCSRIPLHLRLWPPHCGPWSF